VASGGFAAPLAVGIGGVVAENALDKMGGWPYHNTKDYIRYMKR